ncbi:Ankyrin-1 [Trichoderma lentiforme]|uniref:Ankyrin-1 n=1 Tax=Trichoderma lentiforme TaxID=1567552 RepID=A0A9P5CEX9_9HYPO|nr:Ankyrin-1 [Trichoderma lentiforme]
MTANSSRSHADYNVGWVCARLEEQTAAIGMLDEVHESLSKPPNDTNAYTLGSIGQHNIVIACLPKGYAGPNSAATVATQMVQTFPSIKIGLLVGIGGGIPPKVRLGDVVVSTPDDQFPGVVQWDLGKSMEGGKFERTGSLNNPPNSLLSALGKLESKHELEGSKISDFLKQFGEKYPIAAKTYLDSTPLRDLLFKSGYSHVRGKPIENNGVDDSMKEDCDGVSDQEEEQEGEGCVSCDSSQIFRRKQRPMRVHYGLIASSNTTIEDAEFRDRLNKELGKKVLCVEMEAAGLMNSFPCIVIRGICDYADSHRNRTWHKYAAAVAAAFAKELLGCVQSGDIEGERPIRDILNDDRKFVVMMHLLLTVSIVHKVQEQNKALAWLSSIDSASMHHDYIKKCEPGTGQDLLNSEELQQWINIPRTTLFCPGIPGAGKTFQTAILIDYLSRAFRHDDTIGLAFFYYRFDRQDAQKPEQLIANLIKQLGQDHQPSRERIQSFYEGHKKKDSRPLIEELVHLLQVITSLFSRAYVVIDALDECDDTDYSRTRLLDSLFAAQKKGLNICATSRNFHVIEQRFEDAIKWQVTPSENDIFSFLDRRMSQLPDFVQNNIPLQEEIKKCIESAIEGMFLLAQMYIESLVGKRSIASVQRALEGLKTYPKESKDRSDVLSKAYHKAMERIQQQKGDLPADAMTILAWVVKSKRPLPIGTLRLILAIDIEKSMIDEDNFPTADHITQACAPLVVIESKTQEARLAHYTIQEYFERSNDIWMEKSQQLIANTCMSYLSFSNIRSVFKNKVDDEGRFHNYATQFWAHHTAEALAQGLEIQRVEYFLRSRTNSDLWHDSLMQIDLARTSLSRNTKKYLLQISEQVVELHVAACLGLSDVVAELINKGCDPDVRDKRNRSPLWWAAYNGHAGIVELLLERNVDTEVKDTFDYRTPLKLAAKRGSVSVVRLLLDKDADLEPVNTDETGSPIIVSEKVRLARKIVDAMFQPFSTDTSDISEENWCLSPLALAAKQGHEDISALLLRRGARIEVKIDHQPTISALNVAIKAHQESIVKLLLAQGADMDIRDEMGSTALHLAAGQTSIVKLLLSKSADVKSQNKVGSTALHLAAGGNQTSIVELLLLSGADISSRDKRGLTALHTAMMWGWKDMVKLLLSNGADINAQCERGLTPLSIAARGDRRSIVKLLLAHGADMEIRAKDGRTALQIAIESSRRNIAKLLLLYGANINARDNKGLTALHIAATKDNDGLVQFLLTHSAHIETLDNKGYTPLHLAAKSNKPRAVKVLLTHGGDIEARNKYGETPLIAASRSKSRKATDLLMAQGADLAVHDNFGRSVLYCAIKSRLWPTAEQLVTKGFILEDGEAIVCGKMLHSVIIKKSTVLVDLFLNYRVDINLRYDIDVHCPHRFISKGRLVGTALHQAVASGCVAIVSRLLKVDGIDTEAKNSTGDDALIMAIRIGENEIARLLWATGKVRPQPGYERFFEFLTRSYFQATNSLKL